MQLHQLKPKHIKKDRKRIGRGGKKGTYSGRGNKGQKSRAGRKPRPDFAGGSTPLSIQLPKKRGQVNKVSIKRGVRLALSRRKQVILNLKDFEKKFKIGEAVSLKSLLKKGLIGRMKGRIPSVKILGQSESKKTMIFEGKGFKFSKSAQQKASIKPKKEKVKKQEPKAEEKSESKSKPKAVIKAKAKK